MSRIVAPLLSVLLLVASSSVNAAPGHHGGGVAGFQISGGAAIQSQYVSDTGEFLGNLFDNLGVYVRRVLHRAGDDFHQVNKNIAAVADSIGDLRAGFTANFEKNVQVRKPDVQYETHYVKVKEPVQHFVVEEVEHVPAHGGLSAGFAANFEKNIHIGTPKVQYETRYVKVPVVDHKKEKGHDASAETHGGIVASFEKSVQVKTADVKHETKVKTPDIKHEVEYVIPHVHVESHEDAKLKPVKGVNAGFVATGALGIEVGVPHTHVHVIIEKESEAKHVPEQYERKVPEIEKHVEIIHVAPEKDLSSVVNVRKGLVVSAGGGIYHGSHIDKAPVSAHAKKSAGGTTVDVIAPLTSVGVRKNIQGSVDVDVQAPFTHVATSSHGEHKTLSVLAPFTSVKTVKAGINKGVHVQAPFVDVKTGPKGVRVQAPFVDIITGPKNIH